MWSLSDVVGMHIEINRRLFEHYGINIASMLEPDLPALYEEFGTGTPLTKALSQLSLEMQDAKPSKALYKTKLNGNKQRLMILHNGKQIPRTELESQNLFLRDISEGRIEWPYMRHGNRIAAQAIKEWGGRITLENIAEGEYSVRTTLEIPITSTAL